MTRRQVIATAALLVCLGGWAPAATAAPKDSGAAACRDGYFCVWTGVDYTGERFEFSGDDSFWEEALDGQDSSWANKLESGPNVRDHVIVYAKDGKGTICLAPGQAVASDKAANDRGSSHQITKDC